MKLSKTLGFTWHTCCSKTRRGSDKSWNSGRKIKSPDPEVESKKPSVKHDLTKYFEGIQKTAPIRENSSLVLIHSLKIAPIGMFVKFSWLLITSTSHFLGEFHTKRTHMKLNPFEKRIYIPYPFSYNQFWNAFFLKYIVLT